MQNANTAALGALSSGLLAFQGHIRNMHQDAQQSGNPALSALPLHPAFPLQPGYPFYPGGLLAALRPHQMLQNRESGPEVKSPKSFTIDAILGDRDDKQENSSFEDSGDNPDGEAERGHSLSNRGASGRPAGRLEMAGHQFGGHPGHGLPHCPAALRYSQHFNTGNRHEKKPGHVSGSSWKGKSKRVRTIFTPEQLERLEAEFERQQYMVGTERYYLAASLNLTEAQVKVWFQNRRIKWRKQNLEQQHAKMAHFDLFTPDECSESDTECSDRKLMSSPEVREESMLHDDFSAQDATHKNTSFDSGISEDNAASKMAAAVVQRPEIAQYPMMYINPDTLHRATHDSEESGAALD